MGPFEDETALHMYLLKPASSHSFASQEKYEETLALAKRVEKKPHQVVFTHGDLKEHNVLVDEDGNLTGWLDWESAGWCPPNTGNLRRHAGWEEILGGARSFRAWRLIVMRMKLESDITLNRVTVDSYVAI